MLLKCGGQWQLFSICLCYLWSTTRFYINDLSEINLCQGAKITLYYGGVDTVLLREMVINLHCALG